MTARTPAAVVLALLALAACTPSTPRSAGPPESPAPTSQSPAPTTSAPTATPSPTASVIHPGGTMRVAAYYLGGTTSRPVLYREFRTVPRSAGVIRSAVDTMLHAAPADADYRSLWPRATTVRGISVNGATATVDLSANARSVTASAAAERASLQQLVHTVTAAAPSVTGVRLRFDGATRSTLWGHVATTGTLTRGPAAETLGAVWVVTPAQGTRVGRTFTVTGTASVFEATVSWSVTRAGSTTALASGSVNASTGAPGRGDWTVRVTLPAGTTGVVVFTGWEASAEDGSVTSPDTKAFRVV
ncbi:MAG TPA: Gmad2 immunoglobulin-like domain-containing protein [Mycobacteriales bacterium]|jgi:hypothetical protein|nr:Gmad2 immunoglobulin-like domain-containing protein [Mycobacteriales bacterium]